MATRLSFLLWRSMPDDALLAAAEAGQLSADADIAAQAERMLADPRAHAVAIADFHDQWLRIGEIDGVEKDTERVLRVDARDRRADARRRPRAFIDDVVWNGDGTLDALFGAPYTFVNATLAQYYGLPAPGGTGFVKVDLDPTPARAAC